MRNSCAVFALAAASCSQPVSRAELRATQQELNPVVYLKPSSSPRRKPSFYIPRMRDANIPMCSEVIRADGLGTALPLFSITSPSCDYYSLRLPLLKAGFKRLPETITGVECNVIWGKSMPFRQMQSTATHTTTNTDARALSLPQADTPEKEEYLRLLRMSNGSQRFNHFPLSHRNMGCKRGMAINIRKIERLVKKSGGESLAADMYGYSPKTWFYPEEKEELERVFRSSPPSRSFIWKPARGSCGRGIGISEGGLHNEHMWRRIMRDINEKAQHPTTGRMFKHYVVQEYLPNPLLLDGRKMDLRLYVSVTSFNPLTVYLHDEGLVRLAAEPYNDDTGIPADDTLCMAEDTKLSARFKHLTNYSIGRKYLAAKQSQDLLTAVAAAAEPSSSNAPAGAESEGPELKWSLQKLWDHLDAHYASQVVSSPGSMSPADMVKEKISLLIIRTLMSVKKSLTSARQTVDIPGGFFELYGFDIMLDTELNPFLIEINTLPSLESSSVFDYATKCNVTADLLNLAMLEPFERSADHLSTLTDSREALQPPSVAMRSSVHALASPQHPAAGPSSIMPQQLCPQDQRMEVVARLEDELRYARGFKRIFPPVDTLHQQEYPITAASTVLQRELSTYTQLDLITQEDEWALSH